MRVALGYFKETIVAAGLIFVTASILASTAAPNSPGGNQALSVERANKGDRLLYASRSKTPVNNSLLTMTPQVRPPRVPFGCDPTFSALADPTRALIYKRCAT